MAVNTGSVPAAVRDQSTIINPGAGIPTMHAWTTPTSPTAMFIAVDGETDGCVTTVQAAGWNTFIVDRPCEGFDIGTTMPNGADPTGLAGWAARLAAGKDVVGDFVKRANAAAARWISLGKFRPESMYVVGTSRGGMLATHYAATYKVAGFVAFCPLTKLNYSGLPEFNGINANLLNFYDCLGKVNLVKYCPSWVTITPDDTRVGTTNCTDFTTAAGASCTFVSDVADSGHGTPSKYVPGGNALIAMEAARPP